MKIPQVEEIGKDWQPSRPIATPRPSGVGADAGGQPNGEDKEPVAEIIPARATRGGDFVSSYVPLYYTLDGILPSGFLYGVTARRSGGKTAGMIMATCAVIKGDDGIVGCEVEGGRVAYVIKENPIDFQMNFRSISIFTGLAMRLRTRSCWFLIGGLIARSRSQRNCNGMPSAVTSS